MTNQEQYELIWEKAKKYDRLVDVLDKIRAEIEEYSLLTRERVIGIIDKYKSESEDKE